MAFEGLDQDMKMKRSGISDVITSLILILATVSLASVFFFWGLGYLGQSQTATGAGITQATLKTQEQFSIDTVRFWSSSASQASTLVSSGDMATIYVRNYGDVPLTIDHVYFNNILFQACPNGPRSGIVCFAPVLSATCLPDILPFTLSTATGTATGSESSTTLQDTSKSWASGQWVNGIVNITGGTGSGQSLTVVSNTQNTLTVSPAWTTAPVSGSSTYSVTPGTGSSLTVSARAEGCVNLQLSAGLIPNWSVGDTDTILIASTRGNQYTASFTVPVQDFG